MNVPKMSVIIEAEMRIRDYTDKPTEDVYCSSMGSLNTLKSVGLLNAKEHQGYVERMAIIRKAASIDVPIPAPAPTESG